MGLPFCSLDEFRSGNHWGLISMLIQLFIRQIYIESYMFFQAMEI